MTVGVHPYINIPGLRERPKHRTERASERDTEEHWETVSSAGDMAFALMNSQICGHWPRHLHQIRPATSQGGWERGPPNPTPS